MQALKFSKPQSNPQEATHQLYKNWRENFALPLLIGILIFGAIALIPAINASKNLAMDALFIGTYGVTAVVTIIRFPYIVRMGVFLLGVYVLGIAELITHNILGDSLFFFLALIIFATILISPMAGIFSVAIDLLTFIVFGWLFLSGHVTPLNLKASPAILDDWLSAALVIIMFGSVIILGFQRLEKEFLAAQLQIDKTLNTLQEERENLERTVQLRTNDLRKVNEIGRAVTSILDPKDLLPHAAELIQKEFDSYYTAFFLVDTTGNWAELHTATGDAGKVLRENKHKLDLKGRSLVAKAIQTKLGQVGSSSGIEQARIENPLLPYSLSQLALPLVIGNKVFGALEMHSTKTNAFSTQELDTYQNMANEVAIAIENSRLFQEAQQSLQEMRATQRQYLRDAWSSLASEQSIFYAVGDNDPASNQQMDVALSLRDQLIGNIRIEGTSEWTVEQKSLVESIVSQATLALENARLVEESQSIAARERLANEIISKIWSSTNMDSILQTTVRELGRTLEASEVEIEISLEENYGS